VRIARIFALGLALAAVVPPWRSRLRRLPEAPPTVGIGDDKADMFTDARFRALGIKAVATTCLGMRCR